MTNENLKNISRDVLERAIAKGANGGDVIASSGRSFSVSVQQGAIDKYKVSSSAIIGLRVIKDQRVGLAYTESFDSDSLSRVAQQALENAKYAAIDPDQQIVASDPTEFEEKEPSLFQSDSTPVETKLDFAVRMERELLDRDSRVQSSPYNGYSDGEAEAIYMNHLGITRSHRERSFHCYVSALTKDGDRQAMYGFSQNARRFKDLNLDACVAGAADNALALLSAKPVSTGRYSIVFEQDELEQFLSCFIGTFSAKEVLDGKSAMKDKLGQTVASELLTWRDEPQYPQGFYHSSFDDEGQMRRPLSLIKNGVLQSYLHNSATARRMNTEITAHGARSAKSSLGVAATQAVIDPGPHSEGELLERDHLRIIGLKGLHSGTNAVSGHFSLAVEGAYYKAGKLSHYVKDVTISGNFYELLTKIGMVSNKVHPNSTRTFFSPYILFDQLSVAGA